MINQGLFSNSKLRLGVTWVKSLNLLLSVKITFKIAWRKHGGMIPCDYTAGTHINYY